MMRGITSCLAAVVLWAAAANAQTTVDIPIDQASGVATQALLSGNPTIALQIAEAVLSQRPDDRAALLVVAVAAPQLGDARRGRIAGARAWRVSDTPLQRYEAARVTALAAANEERFTLSSFWLRLALIDAPNEAETQRTINDGRTVNRQNPWSSRLSLSLAPSSNVNGGAESAISSAPGNPSGTLSADAQALAGWRADLAVSTSYRLHENTNSRTTVGLNGRASRVWITEETEVPNEAFETNSLELTLRHERAYAAGILALSFARAQFDYRDLDLGGGTTDFEKYDLTRLQIDGRFPMAEQTAVDLTFGRERLVYQAAGIGEVDRYTARAGLTHVLAGGDRINASFGVTASVGDNSNYTSDDYTLSGSYAFAESFGPVSLSLGGGFRWAEYPDYRLLNPVTGGRQDETTFGFLNVGFPDVQFAGFSPGVRFDAARTDSNVSRFDRTSLSAALTISSSF